MPEAYTRSLRRRRRSWHRNECWTRGRTNDASRKRRSGEGPDGDVTIGEGSPLGSPNGRRPPCRNAKKDPHPFHHHQYQVVYHTFEQVAPCAATSSYKPVK